MEGRGEERSGDLWRAVEPERWERETAPAHSAAVKSSLASTAHHTRTDTADIGRYTLHHQITSHHCPYSPLLIVLPPLALGRTRCAPPCALSLPCLIVLTSPRVATRAHSACTTERPLSSPVSLFALPFSSFRVPHSPLCLSLPSLRTLSRLPLSISTAPHPPLSLLLPQPLPSPYPPCGTPSSSTALTSARP